MGGIGKKLLDIEEVERRVEESDDPLLKRRPCYEVIQEKPEACAKAIALMVQGVGSPTVAKQCDISRDTAIALKRIFQPEVQEGKEALATQAYAAAQITGDLILQRIFKLMAKSEELDKESLTTLTTTFGILIDKFTLLKGEATAIVKHEKGVTLEDAQRAINAAKREAKNKGKVIDI